MNCPITITPEAITKLKEFLAKSPEAKYIRVGVKGAGCSGYTWDLDLAEDKKDKDHVFLITDVAVIVDPISVFYLKDTTIDWKEGKMSSGFAFSSPQAKTCGCGESFSLKDG